LIALSQPRNWAVERVRDGTAGTRVSHDSRPNVTTRTDTRNQEQDLGFL